MINYFQSQRLAARAGVPPEIIEKDYFVELILLYIAKDRELKDKLIFRGGTVLRKIYFSDYRFSEDLDFLVANIENLKDYIKLIDHIIGKINLEFPYNLKERFESESDRLQLFISYDIIPEIRAAKELKLDILKDSYIPPTLNKRILFVYDAFRDEKADLRIYTLESVVVDKICRILDVDNEPLFIAIMHVFAEDKDNAMEWLERGYKMRDSNMTAVSLPYFDLLDDDPRYQELLRKMNLAPGK